MVSIFFCVYLSKACHSNINPITYVHNIIDSIAVFDVSGVEVANVIYSLKNSSAGHDEFLTFVGNQMRG